MNVKFHSCLSICLLLAGAILIQTHHASAQEPGLLRNPSLLSISQESLRPTTQDSSDATSARLDKAYRRLPLSFEANRGQTDPQVKFLSRGPGYTLFLTRGGEAVLALRKSAPKREPLHPMDSVKTGPLQPQGVGSQAVLRMKLVGANRTPRGEGAEELPGKANYFTGNDPKNWRTNVPTYGRVKYQAVYPGVDLVYYGNQRQLEYDFVVAPGADPRSIAIGLEGAEKLSLDASGNLVVATRGGEVRFQKPVVYQEIDDVRRQIAGRYVLKSAHQVGFQVAAYDGSRPLIIDPTLVYSTYLGGSNVDQGFGIAVDPLGAAYVTGVAASSDFPTTLGAFQTTNAGFFDAFVTKLNSAGSALVYSAYLGGSNYDQGYGVAVDSLGSAYVTGLTQSTNFPTTTGAFQTASGGSFDAVVTKLNPTGSFLVYSTYLGGSNDDLGIGIAIDASGNAYVTGNTASTNFPTTLGAFDTTHNGLFDAFVTKLNPTGSAPLVYSTYLGGSDFDFGSGVATDAFGNAYVTGETRSTNFPTTTGAFQATLGGCCDAFVTKLNPAGSAPLVYSTYLGGGGSDGGFGIAVDASFNAYVTGFVESTNFPTTTGAFQTASGGSSDAFVTKLNPTGSAPLVYSTYLGGGDFELGRGIAMDASFNAYVTGETESTNFPTTTGALQTAYAGAGDAFVTKLNPSGSAPLVYSTYLGGSSNDFGIGIAADAVASAYVTGLTQSTNFPTTPGAFDTIHNGSSDAFIVKISDIAAPATLTLSPAAATNPVGTQHCVTATVEDAFGNPTPGVTVRFSVTGSVSTSGSATTDANGQATFCYTGPDLPGADAITAFADTDNDGMQDPGEPSGAATKTWVLPVTTPLCEIKITQGGWIIAANGDRASFGGNARSSEEGATQGQEEYQDHGPFQRMNVHSINVLAIVCDGSTEASIYGQATIDGAGSFFYRIKVKDLAEPGRGIDTYWILLANGYDSGEQTLQGGNVQIRRD